MSVCVCISVSVSVCKIRIDLKRNQKEESSLELATSPDLALKFIETHFQLIGFIRQC